MTQLAIATALLMRELVCEQIYRERANWDPEHPNRALGIRSILPEEVIPFAREHQVTLLAVRIDTMRMKEIAAEVLDQIVAQRQPPKSREERLAETAAWLRCFSSPTALKIMRAEVRHPELIELLDDELARRGVVP